MKEITKEEFNKLIFDTTAGNTEWKYEGNKPCVIDFYSTNCGPCKQLLPILAEKSEYHTDVEFYKVNVDTEDGEFISNVFGVRNIPSVFYVAMDKDPILSVGVVSDEQLEMFIGSIK